MWMVVVLAVFVPLVAAPATPLRAEAADVVISEFMAANSTTLFDEDGAASDWVELWNRSAAPVDLAGWHLVDGGATWTFPSVVLGPGAHRVVFASDKAGQHPLHTNFKLSAGGEYLGLTLPDNSIVSQFAPAYPAQASDVSYGISSDGVIGYLATPTPGEPNSPLQTAAAAEPVLSHPGGWLAAPLSVSATSATPGAVVRYTTDGSAPTATHGTVMTGAIVIASTTTLRVAASATGLLTSRVETATFLLMTDVLAQDGTPAGWPSTSVNGQVFDYGFDPDAVSDGSAAIEASLLAAPVLSIVTDQANLTDPATGIYTNPEQSGSTWERPASVELLDGAGGFQIDGGLRLKGGYSRRPSNPKHSFRLFFEQKYDGPLAYPVFGAGGAQVFTTLDLRSEQNLSWHEGSDRSTMLRDIWLRDSEAAVGGVTTRSRWVHLFLDGQYWGLYMLKERMTADLASQLWGGAAGDYDVLKAADDYGVEVADGDDDAWDELWAAIADGTLTDDELASVSRLVDLADLADFWLLNAAAGNLDATPSLYLDDLLGNNWFAVGGDGVPFRFFVDDGELALGGVDHDVGQDRTGPFPIGPDNTWWSAGYFHPGWLHEVLLTRPEYRAIVRDRALRLLGPDGALAAGPSLARWTARREEVAPLIDAEAARWGNFAGAHLGRDDWQAEVQWVEQQWFPQRTARLLEQLAADGLWLATPAAADAYSPAARLSVPAPTG